MSKPILGHWQYTGEAFDVNDYFGFIYLITNNVSGKKYLGRKFFWVWKGRKKVRESPWKSYMGSSKPLLQDIKDLGKSNFTFEIFRLYTTRGGLSYFETYHLAVNDVLTQRDDAGERTWYNNHIGAVKWICPMEASEATRYKLSKSALGKIKTPEHRANIGKAGLGRVMSDETKAKISKAHKGMTRTPEHRANVAKSKLGSKNPSYGAVVSPETRAKKRAAMLGIRAGLNNPRADQNIYNWKHTNSVEKVCTRVELCNEYNLTATSITRLVKGKQKTHKGWSLIKD